MLRAHSAAFASGDAEDYKKARYDLRRSIKNGKRQYRQKLEDYYTTSDPRRMWQGLQHITDYQQRRPQVTSSQAMSSQATLPEELNDFYGHFEALSSKHDRVTPPMEDPLLSASLSVSPTEVRQALS